MYSRESPGTAWVAGAKMTRRTGRREAVSATRYVPRLVTGTDAGPQLRCGLEAVSRSLFSKNSSSSGATTVFYDISVSMERDNSGEKNWCAKVPGDFTL